ncbi:MAG: sulfatase-like hydrolase/transferase [Bacteroidia bacterium]|nr:sulfatase-like hydrolase/transferase [Bacteroidia bacterium]
MKKLLYLVICLLCIKANAQRNVILIVADDMGTDYCGFFENHQDTVSLPNIRKLLAKGVRFTNAMANPLCSPTRAGIFTGRYSFRTGVGTAIGIDGEASSLDTAEVSIPRLLQVFNPDSIAKGHFGKWHLNLDTPAANLLIPNLMGYDYFAGNFRALVYDYYKWKKNTNGIVKTIKTYATTETVNDAISWVKTQPATKPFFLWLAFNAPHDPWHLPPYSLHSYPSLSGTAVDIAAHPKDYYKAALEAMDTEMGRLYDSLSLYNRLDSTDIIFISDNGNPREICQNPLDSLRSKGTLYQGGVNVPLIIAGPSVVNPGRVSHAIVNSVDLFATVLELFNDTTWQNHIPINKPVDSKSLLPIIKDSLLQVRNWTYTELFNSKSASAGGKAIRNENYKYIQFSNGEKGFYNLINDTAERNNLLQTQLTDTDISNYYALCNQLALITGDTANCNALLKLTPTVTHVLCQGDSSGTISLAAIGAEPGYNFIWADGITNRTRNKLPAGSYAITLTDKNGQLLNDSVVIAEPAKLAANTTFNTTKCGGNVFTSITGGVQPYTYKWSNGSTKATLFNVTPATYIVTVTDAHLCQSKDTITVVNNNVIITPPVTNITYCHGLSNTSATAIATGGFIPYSYLWSDGQTLQTATGLVAGNYSVLVTDKKGCKDTTTFQININAPLVLNSSFKKPTCSNDAGSATANINGGKPPYNYLWSTGATIFPKIDSLTAGIYAVTITDLYGCTATTSFDIQRSGNAPSKPTEIEGPAHISCGDSLEVSYTTPEVFNTLTYVWTVPDSVTLISGQGTRFITAAFLPGYINGSISVSAQNYCGQSVARTLAVSSAPETPIQIFGPNSVCANQTQVSYHIDSIPGATGYLWTKPSGATIVYGQGTDSIVLNFKTHADYLRVQAQNACGTGLNKSLFIDINCRKQNEIIGIENLQVYPNPISNVFSLNFHAPIAGNVSLKITDVLGSTVLSQNKLANAGYNTYSYRVTNLNTGLYFLTIVANGTIKTIKLMVSNEQHK